MSASSATRNFRIEVTNGYGQQPQSISRSLYSTIVAVAEPQRTTTFTLVGAEHATVSWNVVEAANPANRSAGFACASSTTPSINCSFSAPTLEYDVSAEAAGARVVLRVTCKYVRREMRSLSEDDRRRYLTALQTVYRTSTREGRARYGADFVGGEFFALWHLGAFLLPLEKSESGASHFTPPRAGLTKICVHHRSHWQRKSVPWGSVVLYVVRGLWRDPGAQPAECRADNGGPL